MRACISCRVVFANDALTKLPVYLQGNYHKRIGWGYVCHRNCGKYAAAALISLPEKRTGLSSWAPDWEAPTFKYLTTINA